MKRIYLDHAASTPMRVESEKIMRAYFTKQFGNPSSLHYFGQEAIAAVDAARESVARELNADFREIIFTGSATEANNLALRGAVKRAREIFSRPRIIISSIEHESVLETARDLEKDGVEVVVIPVDRKGVIDIERLKGSLSDTTVLVSVMYVNNEIGSVQPISEISNIVRLFREQQAKRESGNFKEHLKTHPYPLFHTDAVQAFQYFGCDVKKLGIDLLTLSGHKFGGPKGVGVLYTRINEALTGNPRMIHPIVTGGGQEFGMRSGTENVPGIAAFADAMRRAGRDRKKEAKRVLALKKLFWKGFKKIRPELVLHGPLEKDFAVSAPHIINVAFPHAPTEEILVRLDMLGVSASSGSACASRATTHSHVLSALFEGPTRGIRFSFGRTTSRAEIEDVLKRLARSFSGNVV